MLKLGTAPAEAGWKELLPGIRVRFLPISIKAVRAARRAVAAALRVDVDDIEEAGDALSRELVRRGAAEWEGVTGLDDQPIGPGQLVPVLDEHGEPQHDAEGGPVLEAAIDAAMRDTAFFEAADRVYVRPWTDREREKNGFAGSRNGTSATPAKDTATASATTPPTADAPPTRKAKPRKRARAART